MRIVIADDHPIFLDGLRDLINAEPDLEVIGAVHSGEELIKMVEKTSPEILISDISMCGMNGITATREVRRTHPNIKILMLSMHTERHHVLAALDAGANGYLLKDSARDELISALRTLITKGAYLSPLIANHVVDAVTGTKPKEQPLSRLSRREREVLRMIADGSTTKKIAVDLKVSPKTVASHREHLMNKLDIHSVAELTRFAIAQGLISDD